MAQTHKQTHKQTDIATYEYQRQPNRDFVKPVMNHESLREPGDTQGMFMNHDP